MYQPHPDFRESQLSSLGIGGVTFVACSRGVLPRASIQVYSFAQGEFMACGPPRRHCPRNRDPTFLDRLASSTSWRKFKEFVRKQDAVVRQADLDGCLPLGLPISPAPDI
jgi:hypothetical protein